MNVLTTQHAYFLKRKWHQEGRGKSIPGMPFGKCKGPFGCDFVEPHVAHRDQCVALFGVRGMPAVCVTMAGRRGEAASIWRGEGSA